MYFVKIRTAGSIFLSMKLIGQFYEENNAKLTYSAIDIRLRN